MTLTKIKASLVELDEALSLLEDVNKARVSKWQAEKNQYDMFMDEAKAEKEQLSHDRDTLIAKLDQAIEKAESILLNA
ncbi:MAG: hypothetical protein AB7E85_06550 [Pseudobdellovibrionaceae bacterium]